MRLIDAYALELRVEKFEQLTGMKLDIVHDFVSSAPTIDAVEVVHGKWKRKMVDNGFNIDWVCSKCGYRVMTDFVSYSYCPNCGAKMDGERKTND